MQSWKTVLLPATAKVRDAIKTIDAGGLQIALIVDAENRLLGTVSDGDVRRAILNGISLDSPTIAIMNPNPTTCHPGEDREKLLSTMRKKQLHRIPILDPNRIVVGIETFDELTRIPRRDNIIVLMAGGSGTRLRPLTNDCPKPMLSIGDRPLLETILLNFIEQGFNRFYLSVNYKAEVIMEYFGDGSRWDIDIRYLFEEKKLGTAGALSLLPETPHHPLIVMNGDLLTKVNFSMFLNFHSSHNAKATMCVREYDFQVPYGVVKLDTHRLIGIEEKPVQRFFVNAGIYVLEPEILEDVPKNTYFDMPGLFQTLMSRGEETAVFPIREYWLDIGRHSDLEKAHGDFRTVFQ